MKQRPNLLILGASGNVARAFLLRLGSHRCHFGRLVLLDKNRGVLANRYLDHERLAYTFVQRHLRLPTEAAWIRRLLKQHRIDLALDVSTHNTLPMLAAVDAAGQLRQHLAQRRGTGRNATGCRDSSPPAPAPARAAHSLRRNEPRHCQSLGAARR